MTRYSTYVYEANMPSDQYFCVEILVGDCSIPEYTKNEQVYVESNLFTSVSYSQKVSEVVNGETETQVNTYTLLSFACVYCGCSFAI